MVLPSTILSVWLVCLTSRDLLDLVWVYGQRKGLGVNLLRGFGTECQTTRLKDDLESGENREDTVVWTSGSSEKDGNPLYLLVWLSSTLPRQVRTSRTLSFAPYSQEVNFNKLGDLGRCILRSTWGLKDSPLVCGKERNKFTQNQSTNSKRLGFRINYVIDQKKTNYFNLQFSVSTSLRFLCGRKEHDIHPEETHV